MRLRSLSPHRASSVALFRRLDRLHGFLLGEALLETIDAAGRINKLLLAGEERMALRTELDAELLAGGAGRPRLAARAVDVDLLILRMNLWFHELTSSLIDG